MHLRIYKYSFSFFLSLSPSLQPNFIVHRFSITDEDAGSNSILTYQLVNNTATAFSVTSAPTGLETHLLVARALDYETLAHYHMTLIVRDRGNPARSSSALIDIHLADVADTAPQFNASSYTVSISEATETGTYIFQLLATSADSAHFSAITYLIVGGDNNTFQVDSNTGMLTLQAPLDYEVLTSHQLVVRAESLANPELQTDVPVEVNVLNVNDHTPIFSRGSYEVSVRAMAAEGAYVTTVRATDEDSGALGVVSYTITDIQLLQTFTVERLTGTIFTRTRLNGLPYQFTIEARDGGEPARIGHVNVTVHVTDVGGARPVFTMQQYSVAIAESSDMQPREVEQVYATDSDTNSSQLVYFIESGNTGHSFTIDSDGFIRTQGILDREERARYQLLVVVSDGMLEANVNVSIDVLDVNDETPLFMLSSYVQSVSESVQEGVELLRVTAADRDEGSNGHVTYRFQEDSTLFTVDADSGAISLRAGQALDYERTNRTFPLTVVATDGTFSSTAQVILRVQDENDNPPVFDPTTTTTISVMENQPSLTPLLQVSATDADSAANALIRYSLSGDVRAMDSFGISKETGSLYTTRRLDREVQQNYQLSINATDSGSPSRSDTMIIAVKVLDVIDDPPIFSQGTYGSYITGRLPANSTIVTLEASTRDNVTQSSLCYNVVPGGNASLFALDQSSGVISAVSFLDPVVHEGEYLFSVEVQHQSLSSSVPVRVIIATDDGNPRLRPFTVHFNIYPSLFPATPTPLGAMGICQREDSLTYTFSLRPFPSSLRSYFRINSSTGVLSVLTNVTSGTHLLNVSVSTTRGVGCGLATVHVTLITNATLDNSVVVRFPGVGVGSFAAVQLEQFTAFVAGVVGVAQYQVETYSLQMSQGQTPEGVELALAVRSNDTLSYASTGYLQMLLIARSMTFALSSSLAVETGVCASNTCPNLQTCQSLLRLHPHSGRTPLRTLEVADLAYHSHPFSLAHRCNCPPGYSRRDLCTSELDECRPNPCHFGAECVDLVGDYQCVCPPATTGKNCSIVCPSESCDPCEPNPCLYGGMCQPLLSTGAYTCLSCPSASHAGPNCELNSVKFEPGAYLALPTLGSTATVNLVLNFSTVLSNGLLLYNGRYDSRTDYIAIQLVVGQVTVGVSFGGVATVLQTNSEQRLSDGRWHHVQVQIRNRVSELMSHLINRYLAILVVE